MKITIQPEDTGISFTVSGSGGDKKQPVEHLYFSTTITRAAALKLAVAFKDAAERMIEKPRAVEI